MSLVMPDRYALESSRVRLRWWREVGWERADRRCAGRRRRRRCRTQVGRQESPAAILQLTGAASSQLHASEIVQHTGVGNTSEQIKLHRIAYEQSIYVVRNMHVRGSIESTPCNAAWRKHAAHACVYYLAGNHLRLPKNLGTRRGEVPVGPLRAETTVT